MGTCRGMSSSQCSSRYISWCVDSLTEPPTPVTTAVTAAEFSQPNHRSAGSIPLLLLPPPETGAGGTAFTPQLPQRTRHKAFLHSHLSKPNPHSSSTLHNTDKAANSVGDVGEEGRKGTLKSPEDEKSSEEDSSLPHAGVNRLLLPRSSPVISRHHRPISWHGEETNTSAPSSLDSSSPDSGSLSQNHHGLPTVASMEDLGSNPSSSHRSSPTQEEKKLRCVSLSSNLNHFLTSLFHLPFSGQQGLAEERRGQRPISCDVSHTPGVSASAQPTKQKSSSAVPEFSADIFKTSCELEKENAHFIVVDMVLEVLEGVKWTLSCDRWTSIMDTHQNTGYNMCTRGYTGSAEDSPTCEHKQRCKVNRHTQSRRSDRRTHSSYVHTNQRTQDKEEEDTEKDEAEGQPKTFSVLSTDSGFEDCGAETTLTPKDSLRNAECLAQQLVLQFRRSWFPSCELRRGRQSLRSSLQELPGTGSVAANSSSLTEEIRLRTRMRGSLSWAPPRFQIIFTVQPTLRRSEVVALQHFLCAGCGTEVEPRYIKKLRYCEYLGRYFCDCCHSGSEALIPGRVLSSWDFCKYPVSDFSKQLLDSVWHQPLFDLTCVGKTLCSKVKELDRFKELQEQLLFLRKLLKACRFSGGVMTESEQLPAHLISEPPHLFSMDDLLRLKKGQLVAQARAVLNSAISHVESCELCQGRGFICEFCRERDIIFPFQSECRRCPVCKACFHKLCFVEKKCPKCARIQSRKKRRDGSMKCDG